MIYEKPPKPSQYYKTIDDYHVMARQKGLVFCDKKPDSTTVKCNWNCARCGKKRYTSYNNLQINPGCLVCDGTRNSAPKTIEDYETLAKSKGLVYFGGDIPLKTTNLLTGKRGMGFVCTECDTIRTTSYDNLKNTRGCQNCAKNAAKKKPLPPEAYYQLADEVGLTWLGETPPPLIKDKTLWVCKNGHRRETSFNWIKKSSGRCYRCEPRTTTTEEDYLLLSDNLGVFWTGENKPKNMSIPTSWECSMGHQWKQTFSQMRLKQTKLLGACPKCRNKKTSKKSVLEFQDLARHHSIKWLRPLWFDLSCGQYSTVWWSCPKRPGHIWQEQYAKLLKTPKGKACPFCADVESATKIAIKAATLDAIIIAEEDKSSKAVRKKLIQKFVKKAKKEIKALKEAEYLAKRRQRTEYETLGKITGWQWIGPPGFKETRWLCPECDNKPLATFQDVEAGLDCRCGYRGEIK